MNTSPDASTPLEEDILVYRYIDKKFSAIEANLFTSKWFDYRFMTPVQATRLYAKDYSEAFVSMYRRHFDSRSAPYIKPLKHEDIFDYARSEKPNKAVLTGLWRGRQFADALGMPYPVFIENAFDVTLRYWNQRWAPMPQHLYTERVIERLAEAWPEIQKTQAFEAEDSRYGNDWYIGTREQNDHHEWLFARAKLLGDEAWRLACWVLDEKLPEEKVLARLTGDERDEFLQVLSDNRF